MGNKGRWEYLLAIYERYQKAGRKAKKVILSDFCANGIPINANPFSFPDATINSSTPVTVNVQAQFIPIGTIPKIIVMSETGRTKPSTVRHCRGPAVHL